jgi:hypothetical protein
MPPSEYELSRTLVHLMWERFMETYMKPTWLKHQQTVEKHLAEKARLLQTIDGLQDALRLHDVVRTKDDMMYPNEPLGTVTLSQKTLENMVITMQRAETDKGLHVALRPRHVFSQWVLDQMPESVRSL